MNACHYRSLEPDRRRQKSPPHSTSKRTPHSTNSAPTKSGRHQRKPVRPQTRTVRRRHRLYHTSLPANLFPLAFGLVPESHRRKVVDFIESPRHGMQRLSPTVYLLESLYDAGAEQAALDLMTSDSDRSWLNMIRVGSTVTTEAWDIKYKKNSGWTHAWSSSPRANPPAQTHRHRAAGTRFRQGPHPPAPRQPHPRQHPPSDDPRIPSTPVSSAPNQTSFELHVTLPATSPPKYPYPTLAARRTNSP